MFAHLLRSVAADPMWTIHPHLSPESLQILSHAKAELGLPAFLRSGLNGSGSHKVSVVFAFVKSKCFADSGGKQCQKPNHSCCRRMIDTSQSLFSSSWKVVGRAVRGVAQSLPGHEVFEPHRGHQEGSGVLGPATSRRSLLRALPCPAL